MWLSIGLCWKITKIRTTPVLVSYSKQAQHSQTRGICFYGVGELSFCQSVGLWRAPLVNGRCERRGWESFSAGEFNFWKLHCTSNEESKLDETWYRRSCGRCVPGTCLHGVQLQYLSWKLGVGVCPCPVSPNSVLGQCEVNSLVKPTKLFLLDGIIFTEVSGHRSGLTCVSRKNASDTGRDQRCNISTGSDGGGGERNIWTNDDLGRGYRIGIQSTWT